jgi:hypothetical protein
MIMPSKCRQGFSLAFPTFELRGLPRGTSRPAGHVTYRSKRTRRPAGQSLDRGAGKVSVAMTRLLSEIKRGRLSCREYCVLPAPVDSRRSRGSDRRRAVP